MTPSEPVAGGLSGDTLGIGALPLDDESWSWSLGKSSLNDGRAFCEFFFGRASLVFAKRGALTGGDERGVVRGVMIDVDLGASNGKSSTVKGPPLVRAAKALGSGKMSRKTTGEGQIDSWRERDGSPCRENC